MVENDEMKLAVLGLGHVGLPTALGLADLGWSVLGADDDEAKAERISRGEVPFYETGDEALLRQHLDSGKVVVRSDVGSAIREATVLFVLRWHASAYGRSARLDPAGQGNQHDRVKSQWVQAYRREEYNTGTNGPTD